VRNLFGSTFLLLLSLLPAKPVLAQELEGRFYPAQSSYSLGEPLLFWVEIKNVSNEPVVLFEKGPGQCFDRFEFSVQRVSAQGIVGACVNSWDTDCGDKLYELKPGDAYVTDWPLDFWFRFDKPGQYQASIRRRFGVYSGKTGFKDWSLHSDFDFKVADADPAYVETVMRKFETDLQSKNPEVRHDALDVIETTAPPYMEVTALRLAHADDAFTVLHAVGALNLLNTAAARASLAEVITTRHANGPDEVDARCLAIQGLGRSGDSSYLTVLGPYADHVDTCESEMAMIAIATLGKSAAVGQLQTFLQSSKPTLRKNAAEALRFTTSPEAVDALISALRDKDDEVRTQASTSLTQLTGHTVGASASPLQAENLWRTWWQSHRDTKLIDPSEEVCRL